MPTQAQIKLIQQIAERNRAAGIAVATPIASLGMPSIPTLPSPIVPATFLPGTYASSPFFGLPIAVAKPTGVLAGDWLIAFLNLFHDGGGVDISDFTAGLPAGWTIVRQDPNPAIISLHGYMYAGVFKKLAGISEPSSYTFNQGAAGATHNSGQVSVVVARGSSGVEAAALTALNNPNPGKINAAGVATAQGSELVFVAGMWGTGSGSIISSDNGLPYASPVNTQANQVFYRFSTGLTSAVQPLTCTNNSDAFTAYQVSMLGT